jgi:hypothetical protein
MGFEYVWYVELQSAAPLLSTMATIRTRTLMNEQSLRYSTNNCAPPWELVFRKYETLLHLKMSDTPLNVPASEVDDPMDLDPIDGGPMQTSPAAGQPSFPASPLWINSTNNNSPINKISVTALMATSTTTEEEARQCIEKLRGDNVAERVEAAHCLDQVAKVLGQERTRRVSIPKLNGSIYAGISVAFALTLV